MDKLIDNILTAFFVFTFVTIVPVTYVVVNVATRPDTITVALELPQPKGVVTVWEPIDNDEGLGLPPRGFPEYWEARIRDDNDYNAFYNMRAYTDEERACMAQNIYFEARNESLKGKIAVALVTLERVQDPRYPSNVCDVVYDSHQFSWYWDGLPDRPRNMEKYEEIALIASAVMDNDTALYDYTYGSTHYHADYVEPYWSEYLVFKTKIDTHLFYYEPPKVLTASL